MPSFTTHGVATRLTLAVVLLMLPLAPFALTCSVRPPPMVVEKVTIAFIGVPVAISPSEFNPRGICWEQTMDQPLCGGKLVEFTVRRVLKGSLPARVSVLVEDGCYCLGPTVTMSHEYLIVADPNITEFPGDHVARDLCWGSDSVEVPNVQELIKAFEAVEQSQQH